MFYRSIFFIFGIISFSLISYSETIDLSSLIELKHQKLISEEEYDFLRKEIMGEESAENNLFYDLMIDSKLMSKTYEVLNQDNKFYFPLKKFFKIINFSNYDENKKFLIARVGSNLREIKIDLNSNNDSIILKRDIDEIYIEATLFSKLFLKSYTIDKDKSILHMYLSFDTPGEIGQMLNLSNDKLLEEQQNKELIYNSERRFFDLGYMRFELGQTFEKNKGEKKYKSDWDGNLEYQGGFLYGQITTDYNFRNNELNTIELKYDNIWKGHTLNIENRRIDKKREWGFYFFKDKGYFETAGGQIIIRESVPIGSRVELLYMGSPIEIKDDKNGVVEFDNPLIRTDRTYILRIYQPDGKIYEKEIKTVNDYNLQQKNQTEYKLGIHENSQFSKYESELELFYGLTNNFTLGLGFSRSIEELNSKSDFSDTKASYLDDLKLDLVYGGTYNAFSYIFNISGTQTLNDYSIYKTTNSDTVEKISSKDRYTYKYLNQFNYRKWKLIYEHQELGNFYDEKTNDKLDLKYDILDNTSIGYQYELKKYYGYHNDEDSKKITFDNDYSWNKFLFSTGTSVDVNESNNNEYRVGMYYSGWEKLTGRLENVWTENGRDYEVKATLYNNNLAGFLDFSSEISYSKVEKEKFTFNFSMKLDNWFKFDTSVSDSGEQTHKFGIDRIVDLKNPKINLDTMDNSRVKIITFVDKNDNNIFDKGEEKISGIEAKIGDKSVITDKNGEGIFYGIGNGNIYDLDVVIKKPSYTLGNNKIKIKSNFSSTIDAYIPIKPMLSLTGTVKIDRSIPLSENDKVDFYRDLVIELKDLNGKVIETTAPDNEGIFEISGLFPKDYYIEITYLGIKPNLKSLTKKIELRASKGSNSLNVILLNINKNNIEVVAADIKNNLTVVRR